jgi:hypothetical protein
MFKKNDYIVLIANPINREGAFLNGNSGAFIVNNVYKQRRNATFLEPESDSNGNIENGWTCYSYKHGKAIIPNWRYATIPEILMYDKIGKPYNVELRIKKIDNYSII